MILGASEFTTTALLLATFGVLLVLCAVSSRATERLGIPIVLLFLALGMLAGSEGVGRIEFENYTFAFRLGTMALALILLDGGLNTSVHAVRESLGPAAILATIGVVLTAALVAGFARVLGMPWTEAALLGAVVSSTDAAAVFAVLRGGRLQLKQRVGTTLELESGLNDPMAVILTTTMTTVLTAGDASWWWLVASIPLQLGVGLGMGLAVGYGARSILARLRLPTAGLYPVLTLGVAFLAFGAATLLSGSGFLAVYVAAIVLGNGPLPYRSGLTRIHDALAWLSQIAMFLTLGLLVFPSRLVPVAGTGLAIALFLAVAARPAAVAACLAPFRFPPRQIGYIGWVGLRGAVPIILATFPVLSGVPGAVEIFNVVFFIVVVNSLIPGITIRWVTRRERLQAEALPSPAAAIEIHSMRPLHGELLSFYVSEALAVCGASLSQVPFPAHAAAILVIRGEELIAARGATRLQAGDHVYVFCRAEDRAFIELMFGSAFGGS